MLIKYSILFPTMLKVLHLSRDKFSCVYIFTLIWIGSCLFWLYPTDKVWGQKWFRFQIDRAFLHSLSTAQIRSTPVWTRFIGKWQKMYIQGFRIKAFSHISSDSLQSDAVIIEEKSHKMLVIMLQLILLWTLSSIGYALQNKCVIYSVLGLFIEGLEQLVFLEHFSMSAFVGLLQNLRLYNFIVFLFAK